MINNEENDDFEKRFIRKEEYEKIVKKFTESIKLFLEKNESSMLVLKGGQTAYGYSTTFGSYEGKLMSLYLSKNSEKVKNMDLNAFYLNLESELYKKEGNRIDWRTNRLLNLDTNDTVGIEFIPLALRGSFLKEVFQTSETSIPDMSFLVMLGVHQIGKILHEILCKKGFSSTYPRVIKNFDKLETDKISKELKESDFHIEFRYVEKSVFLTAEKEIIEKSSESNMEKSMGLALIKEGIPFIPQYEIKENVAKQKSRRVISKPDYFIVGSCGCIAIFCDSRKYHNRKKNQLLKDKRINERLQKMGFVVLRFTDKELTLQLEKCIEKIKEYYLGDEYALSKKELFQKKIAEIESQKLSVWEERFIEKLKKILINDTGISSEDEQILNQIHRKHNEHS